MTMRSLAAIALLVLAVGSAPAADRPAGERIRDITQYIAVMKAALADEGIEIKRIDSPGQDLLVIYTVTDSATGPEFALGAVLCLAQPLARDAQLLRARSVEDGRKLLELAVPPGQLKSSLMSVVTDAELAAIEALRAGVFERCGIEELAVPVAADVSTPRDPATIIHQGDAPARDEPAQVQPPAPETPEAQPAVPPALPAEGTAPAAPDASEAAPAAPEDDSAQAPLPLSEDEAQELADALVAGLRRANLENVTVGRDAAGQWIIGLENRTWRSDIAAVAEAMAQIAEVLPPARIMLCLKRHDVAVSHVWIDLADYVKLQSGLASAQSLAETWEVSPGPGNPVEPVSTLARGNQSFARTDVLVRPALEYEIGNEADPFIGDLFLVPTARTTWSRGLWSEVRVPGRVSADQALSLDRALLVYAGRPAEGLLATASAGRFDRFTYGYYGEMQWDDEQHRLGAVGTLTGDEPDYGPFDMELRGFLYYEYDWGQLGLNSRLGWGKFERTDDSGLALSLRRRFGESVVEARAVRTDDGTEGLFFELSLPLGPQRSSPPSGLRLRTDPELTVDYSSDFVVQGKYLQGSHDLESFRGQLAASYLQHHGDPLAMAGMDETPARWPGAPSFEGTSGLLRIPTADVAPEGMLLAGISYMDREHSKVEDAVTDAMPVFIGAGFLPNLELIGRLTFFHDVKAFNWPYNLDRSFNVHYRTNDQKGWLPAVAVGAQDVTFGTTTSYLGKAEYIVGSWERADFRLHLGVGSGRYDPGFGGLEYALPGEHRIHLITEFDSDYVNAGLRYLDDWGSLDVGLLGMSRLTGAITFQTPLQ